MSEHWRGPKIQWEVFPIDNRSRAVGSSVYVEAPTEERALEIGKRGRAILGMKAARNLKARRYYPHHDPAFANYIERVTA